MKIGMIGVGLMGHGIATNILKDKAHHVNFLAHQGNQPTDALEAAGATASPSIKETIANAKIRQRIIELIMALKIHFFLFLVNRTIKIQIDQTDMIKRTDHQFKFKEEENRFHQFT